VNTTDCTEKETSNVLEEEKVVRSFILEQERKRATVEEKPLCSECSWPMTIFHWPIFLCMRCFMRRTERQVRASRELLRKLRSTDPKEHGETSFDHRLAEKR